MVSLYCEQLAGGRHFLREHPQGASSWQDKDMLSLLRHPGVPTRRGSSMHVWTNDSRSRRATHACKESYEICLIPQMLARLHRVSSKYRERQPLLSGRADAAACYPPEMVRATPTGIRDTADFEAQPDR